MFIVNLSGFSHIIQKNWLIDNKLFRKLFRKFSKWQTFQLQNPTQLFALFSSVYCSHSMHTHTECVCVCINFIFVWRLNNNLANWFYRRPLHFIHIILHIECRMQLYYTRAVLHADDDVRVQLFSFRFCLLFRFFFLLLLPVKVN